MKYGVWRNNLPYFQTKGGNFIMYPNVTSGTLYVQGAQVRFHQAVTQALNMDHVDPSDLKLDITVDVLQTIRNHDLTYRIRYTYQPLPRN